MSKNFPNSAAFLPLLATRTQVLSPLRLEGNLGFLRLLRVRRSACLRYFMTTLPSVAVGGRTLYNRDVTARPDGAKVVSGTRIHYVAFNVLAGAEYRCIPSVVRELGPDTTPRRRFPITAACV